MQVPSHETRSFTLSELQRRRVVKSLSPAIDEQDSLVRRYAVEYPARVPQESQLAEPQDAVFGASIEVGDIYNAVSCLVHPSNHPGDRIFMTRAANRYFDEEDVGLAQQIGCACQNFEVEALGVDLNDLGQRSAYGRRDFIEGHHRNRNSRGVWVRQRGIKRTAIVTVGNRKRQSAGLVRSAGINPGNFATAFE